MTVVKRREMNGSRDQFPIGMRVLAVDDDPTCLKVLESLLLRCQYHVTTTNQAIKALEMLRENKDQFDLVISDVHMPDMDGFKLLELVGLEMDLPVIMLSANGETQAVMKGITHGACDYLLKPVRIEELKNIWQHVVRRKKFDTIDQNNNLDNGEECDKNQHANSEGAQGLLANGSSDRKLNRKRKDQNEEDEDDGDDNMHENEDPSAQKKPRVVWSVDLHRKFVAAVNHLGLDKAVPKRILDLMNVEGLTRENVASHLQKYRLYLKRLSAVANQQANMVAALRGRDSSYIPMGSLDGYANFNSLIGSRPLPGPRLNSFNGFGLHGFVPSGTSQLGRSPNNTNNTINDVGKLHGVGLPTVQVNQQGTFIQGMQQPKAMQEANKNLLGGFSSCGLSIGQSSSSFTNAAKTSHMLNNQQQTQSGALCSQSSVRIQPPLSSSDSFEIGTGVSLRSADLARCNETWQGAVLSSTYHESTMSCPFSNNIRSNISTMVSSLGNCDRLGNLQNQASPLLTTSVNGDSNVFNIRSSGNSNLKWDHPARGHTQNDNPANFSVSNIQITDQNAGNQKLGNEFSNKKLDMPIMGQTSFGAPLVAQDSRSVSQLHYKDEHLFEDAKLAGGISSGGFGLDDLVANAMVKPECDDFTFIDGDIGCNDLYSLGACM